MVSVEANELIGTVSRLSLATWDDPETISFKAEGIASVAGQIAANLRADRQDWQTAVRHLRALRAQTCSAMRTAIYTGRISVAQATEMYERLDLLPEGMFLDSGGCEFKLILLG